MKEHAIFDSLVNNAFDFLKKGVDEFDHSPKYSVINFCAAVEMILKARLMCEHWSLIVSKPEQANYAKFMAGEFVSVTMEEARVRLRDIAQEDIADNAFNSFRALANHRNKMIHFFHADMEGDDAAKAQIVAEHCRSWFHLHRLLNQWSKYFHDFSKEIDRADRAMKSHRKYLSAKFKALKPELDAARVSGLRPAACNACGFKAALPHSIGKNIALVECIVCDHKEAQVKLACPECEKNITIASEGYGECPHCESAIEPEDIVYALTDHGAAHIAAMEGDDSYREANCSCCDGYQTVVHVGDQYFCANCFQLFDHVSMCGWCNEPNTGDMSHSYGAGCNHCDGRAGYEKDD